MIIVIVCGLAIVLTTGNSTSIGSNNLGHVDKVVYSHQENAPIKIAIVSGMHSRETLHSTVLPFVSKLFAFMNIVEIVNYQVKVTDNPNDFNIGRSNGESLVHDYVVSDVAKSNLDLVIIGHDHEDGYGDGYYIATPTMDNSSVSLGDEVLENLSDFKYYKRDSSSEAKSSSISKVDNPIVATGTPVFVYEIPENDDWFNAIKMSYELIDASFKALSN